MDEIIKCPHCNGQLPIHEWAIYQKIKQLEKEKLELEKRLLDFEFDDPHLKRKMKLRAERNKYKKLIKRAIKELPISTYTRIIRILREGLKK